MSLGRLLTAGKSFIGMKDITSRYRMRSANLLPKFGSPKNPFVSRPKTESSNSPAPMTKPAQAQPAKMETCSLFEPKPQIPVIVPKPVAATPPPAQPVKVMVELPTARPVTAVPAKKPALLAEWAKKLNPLLYLPARLPKMRTTKTRPVKTAVQAELSLERVRVVRNDLSDTDLEVIPARPAEVPPNEVMPKPK